MDDEQRKDETALEIVKAMQPRLERHFVGFPGDTSVTLLADGEQKLYAAAVSRLRKFLEPAEVAK